MRSLRWKCVNVRAFPRVAFLFHYTDSSRTITSIARRELGEDGALITCTACYISQTKRSKWGADFIFHFPPRARDKVRVITYEHTKTFFSPWLLLSTSFETVAGCNNGRDVDVWLAMRHQRPAVQLTSERAIHFHWWYFKLHSAPFTCTFAIMRQLIEVLELVVSSMSAL